MSNWRVDTPDDRIEPPEILEIRSLIKIVDTRNLSDEESEKQYNDWWCGEKDDCFSINTMFDCITVNADNYEQAEQKFEDGDVDSIEEVESSLIFSECIKMPENIDEETK